MLFKASFVIRVLGLSQTTIFVLEHIYTTINSVYVTVNLPVYHSPNAKLFCHANIPTKAPLFP